MSKKPKHLQVEHRVTIAASHVECRMHDDGAMPTLTGYAAVFNSPTDLGWFTEEIAPGAFAQSLGDGADVRALYNHDTSQVIGRRNAKTLRISEDAIGLKIEIDLPDTTTARDLVANINAGNIDGMSFGFIAQGQQWTEYPPEEKKNDHRLLTEIELIEVSPVTFPAYPDTSIAKRSREHAHTQSPAGQDASEESRKKTIKPSLEVLRLRAARLK